MAPRISPRRALRWALPALALGLILFAPVPTSAARLFPAAAPTERHFRVEAGDFAYTPHTLQVNPGDRVTIELVSTDVVHGIAIDGYDLSLTADPGQPASLTFTADQAGTFRLRCSVTCGALHPFMIGKLKVGTNWLFWRALAASVVVALAGVWTWRSETGRP